MIRMRETQVIRNEILKQNRLGDEQIQFKFSFANEKMEIQFETLSEMMQKTDDEIEEEIKGEKERG